MLKFHKTSLWTLDLQLISCQMAIEKGIDLEVR